MRRRRSRHILASSVPLLAAAWLSAACGSALAQEEAGPPPPAGAGTLTGDWGGARTALRNEHGVTLAVSATNTYQGLANGDGDKDGQFGGRVDAYLTVDLGRLAHWQGWYFTGQLATRYGDSVNNRGSGIALPVNTALYVPGDDGTVTDIGSFFVTKAFSKTNSLSFGRFNTVDLPDARPFIGGHGVTRFMNVGLVAPPLEGRTIPVVTNGAIFKGGLKGGQDYLLAVFDPMTTYDNDGLSHPFDNGATFMGVFGWPTKFGTSMGRHSLTATYSTLTTRSLTSGGWIILPDPPRPLPEKEGTWTVNYSFDQYLGYRPSSPSKGFGVFGELGFSDGDPNAIELYASLGVGGTSPLKGREQDSFGFGVFYMGLGDSVKDGFAPLIRLGDETGIEAYYNWAATPWLRLTGDLQVVDPALANRETAVILGLRSEVRF